MKPGLTWLSESTEAIGPFPLRMLPDSARACVCACSEFTRRRGREPDGGDCESAANVNGETIRRGPRQ